MRLLRSAARHWTEGKGYSKRLLVTEEELGISRSFVQEVQFHLGEHVPLHYHGRTKEVFIALDRAPFQVNGQEVVLEPEDVLICEPGDIHGNPIIPHSFRILVIKIDYDPNDTVWLS